MTSPANTPTATSRETASPGWLAFELSMIHALWRRDVLRLVRERTRWIGLVLQPLMFWVIIGTGLSDSLVVPGQASSGALRFFYPGILAMVVLFTSIFSTMSIIEDRASGFLQAVLVAPGSRMAMVLGKTLGVTTIVLAQAALFLLAAPWAGYPWGGIHWPALLAVLVISNVALSAINFVFAWVINSTGGYHALMAVVLMPLWMVSGAMFPSPGGWMGWVVVVNPMSYQVAGLAGALGGQGAFPLDRSLAILVVEMVVFLFAAMIATRRRGE